MFQICRLSAANTAPFEKFHMLVLLMQKYVFLALAYLRPQVLHHSSRLITNPHIQCLQYSNDLSCFKLLIWYFESSILCVMKNLSYFKFTLFVRQNEGQLVLIPYNWDQIKQAHLGKRNESRGARTMMQNKKCWRKIRRFFLRLWPSDTVPRKPFGWFATSDRCPRYARMENRRVRLSELSRLRKWFTISARPFDSEIDTRRISTQPEHSEQQAAVYTDTHRAKRIVY